MLWTAIQAHLENAAAPGAKEPLSQEELLNTCFNSAGPSMQAAQIIAGSPEPLKALAHLSELPNVHHHLLSTRRRERERHQRASRQLFQSTRWCEHVLAQWCHSRVVGHPTLVSSTAVEKGESDAKLFDCPWNLRGDKLICWCIRRWVSSRRVGRVCLMLAIERRRGHRCAVDRYGEGWSVGCLIVFFGRLR